jgi:hypothetical protein
MSKQTSKTMPSKSANASGVRTDLDGQYGSIGISAVAAALPYRGEAKNPAYAPAREDAQRDSDFSARFKD